MPTYSYRCSNCQHEMDLFQKISDVPETHCPQCQKETLQRGLGGGQAVFQFKGKGFYQTDYKANASPGQTCCPCGKKANTDCKS